MYEVGSWLVSSAQAATEVMPTSEEAGFKLTVNLGQLIQVIGIGIPFLLYINKMSIRHALLDANMAAMSKTVSALQADMKTVSLALAQLPTLLHTTRANHRMLQTVLGGAFASHAKSIDDQVTEDNGDGGEYLKNIADSLKEIGKS